MLGSLCSGMLIEVQKAGDGVLRLKGRSVEVLWHVQTLKLLRLPLELLGLRVRRSSCRAGLSIVIFGSAGWRTAHLAGEHILLSSIVSALRLL